MPIHASAVIDKRAEISESAEIGPFAVIDGPVRIGARVKIYPGAYINGWTQIDEDCEIHPHAVIGHLPQDLHYQGERSFTRIGAGTVIREHASVHRGTQPETTTVVGKNCLLLAGAHVAHNCDVGDNVKLLNNSQLAGHVTIMHNATVSAAGMVHQFARVGEYAFVAGGTRLLKDLPPYFVGAYENQCVSYNAIGLRRSGDFTSDEIDEIRRVYRGLYRTHGTFTKAVEKLQSTVRERTGRRILEFVTNPSSRGIIGGRATNVGQTVIRSGAGDAPQVAETGE